MMMTDSKINIDVDERGERGRENFLTGLRPERDCGICRPVS